MENYDLFTTCLDPERSNVMPVSNVAVRLEKGGLLSDRAFFRQVRGPAVAQLIEKLLGCSLAISTLSERQRIEKALATHQWEQRFVHLTCQCGRIDFGPIRQEDGSVRWGYLKGHYPCRCKRASNNSQDWG